MTWKLLKVHINLIIQNIVFPLLCHSKDDQELWEEDPQEFIRVKFDVFEDAVSPVSAAQTLLHTTCKKRKGMLEKTLQFVVSILNNPAADPPKIDGALKMVGSVVETLLKKDQYKDQLETMVVTYVLPQMESPHGFLRAKACWVMQEFADVQFKNDANLVKTVELVAKCLMTDKELPVKVEAAICLQHLVSTHNRARILVEPNIKDVAIQILDIIKKTENETMTDVLQKLVCLFSDQLIPVSYDLIYNLAQTFDQLVEDLNNDDESEDKSLVGMSVLNTIDTILSMMDEQPEMMSKIEPVVVNIIVKVLQGSLIDLYEEVLNLVATITSTQVSSDAWKVFELMYQIFNRDALDYFTEMAPSFHNFITVDPQAFISNQNHVLAIYNVCKTVLNSDDPGDDAESLAAKLIEVIILQFKGQIDTCIQPFLELTFARLTKECHEDLKTMLLHILVASLVYNADLFLQTLLKLQPPTSTQSLFEHFLKQWMSETHEIQGIHDRKLSVLGLITLMTLPRDRRPAPLVESAKEVIPSALLLFEGLKETYAARAKADAESEDEEEEDDDYEESSDPEELEDDQDLIPGSSSFPSLARVVQEFNNNCPFPVISATMDDVEEEDEDDDDYDDEDEDEYDFEETLLESYTTAIDANHVSLPGGEGATPVDEFILFKQVLERLQAEDTEWFSTLMAPLSADQQKALQDVLTNAVQRQAAESKSISCSPFLVL